MNLYTIAYICNIFHIQIHRYDVCYLSIMVQEECLNVVKETLYNIITWHQTGIQHREMKSLASLTVDKRSGPVIVWTEH